MFVVMMTYVFDYRLRAAVRTASLLITILLFYSSISASAISDYRARLDKAHKNVEGMIGILIANEYGAQVDLYFREFMEWLANIFPRSSIPTETPSGLQPLSVILQFVIYGLVIALVGFLIYRFGPLLMERFRNRERKEIESRVILGERIDASTSATDLFAEAENLARQRDLRGAIRKGYVALLCELADRKVIGLARHKTNRDYPRH